MYIHQHGLHGFTSCNGPSDTVVGSPLSNACSHNFMDLWSSFRCPHFGHLANPEATSSNIKQGNQKDNEVTYFILLLFFSEAQKTLPILTIFINWCIIVITCGNEWSAGSASEVRPTMILKGKDKPHYCYVWGWRRLLSFKRKTKNHVVVLKASSFLKKACNWESNIFSRPMRITCSKCFKPEKFKTQGMTQHNTDWLQYCDSWHLHQFGLLNWAYIPLYINKVECETIWLKKNCD